MEPASPKVSGVEFAGQAGTATAISGFVLAGGKSFRLQQDKVLLPWAGGTLLDHAIQRLRRVSDSVRVCGDREDLNRHLPESCRPVLHDALPNAGPLGGIVAALEQSQTGWNLFLAVDLPLLPVQLLQALVALAISSRTQNSGALCILPQVDGRPQPLCGLYHRSLAPGLRGALFGGKYKITRALEDAVAPADGIPDALPDGPTARVEFFDVQEFAEGPVAPALTEAGDWFLNINTPQDWRSACALALSRPGG